MNALKTSAGLLLALLAATAGCASTPSTAAEKADLSDDAQTKLRSLERDIPDLKDTVEGGYGYAILPSIAKGGLVFEGASGLGVVYEQDQFIGYAHLTMVNFGAVIGGEDYTELLVFKTKAALDDFKANNLKFNAHAGATALKAGVQVNAKFVDDVAVLIQTNSGFDIDASIGGQQFTFTSDPNAPAPAKPAVNAASVVAPAAPSPAPAPVAPASPLAPAATQPH